MRSRPKRSAISATVRMLRPSIAIRRPNDVAASTAWEMRATWLENVVRMIRPGAPSNASARPRPATLSESARPGRSALVESTRARSTPSPTAFVIPVTSVVSPSGGSGSSLKSPEWKMRNPAASMRRAAESGTECETRKNVNAKAPAETFSPPRASVSRAESPASSSRRRAIATVNGRA